MKNVIAFKVFAILLVCIYVVEYGC